MNTPPRANELFQEALAIADPAARSAFLHNACKGDDELRTEVGSLLDAHDRAGDFLNPSPQPDLPTEKPGDRIGHYKLLEMIGEGSFGQVWMAEQEEPMRRKVALKVVKLGMDTREVLARFEAERQALALMNHPNIARVFDGGATGTGRPYFAMELVLGLPITKYCDTIGMPPAERIDLFRKVCLAVQHAHQKGIIHRDLKPANILVTVQDDKPVPKVIDFGIAKALQARLTERTLFTHFNQWIGTPEYMSPEQAGLGSLDVDTRSDIYSLGTILYELLTGHTPFDDRELRRKGFEAILKAIREEDPQKASTRLTTLPRQDLRTVAEHRGRTPERLQRVIKGELDWILLKALDRDRARRYETANALAKDLERYSSGEAISAVPPSLAYQARKFIRRHPEFVPTATFALLMLLALSVWITWKVASRPKPIEFTGEPLLKTLVGHDKPVRALSVSAERGVMASASWDGTVKLWSLKTGTLLASLPDHNAAVWGAAFSPGGDLLASAGYDDRILLWDVGKGKLLRVFNQDEIPEYTMPTLDSSNLEFSPDGAALAAVGRDGKSVNLWDVETSRIRSRFEFDDMLPNQVTFSPDGTQLAVTGSGHLGILDIASGKRLWWQHAVDGVIHKLSFSPDGKTLAGAGSDHFAWLWDVETGEPFRLPYRHDWIVHALAFSDDGKLLATGTNAHIHVWDTASRRRYVSKEFAHFSLVTGLEFLPDNRTLISSSESGYIKFWDVQAVIQARRQELKPGLASGSAVGKPRADAAVAHWNFEDGVAGEPFTPDDGSGSGSSDSVRGILMRGFDQKIGPSFSSDNLPGNGLCMRLADHHQDGYATDETLRSWSPLVWTIECSVKMDTIANWSNNFIGRDGSSDGGEDADFYLQYIRYRGAEQCFRFSCKTTGGQQIEIKSSPIRAKQGQWYGLAVVSDGKEVRLYIDDDDGKGYEPAGSARLAEGDEIYNALSGKWLNWTFGRGWWNGRARDQINGAMDNIRFSNAALRPDELIPVPNDPVENDGSFWTTSLEEARKRAAAEGKDIFMEFSGSDWCPPCMRFHDKVLSKESFLTEASKQFVLLNIDNPRDKSGQSEAEIEQYKTLDVVYDVSGVPTVFLTDADGLPYDKTVGYGGVSVEDYVESLSAKPRLRERRDELLGRAENAEGIGRARLLNRAIAGIDSDVALHFYGRLIDEIMELDDGNKAGLKAKYHRMRSQAEITSRLKEIRRRTRDSEEMLKKIDELVDELTPQGEALQAVLFLKAQSLRKADKEASRMALEDALNQAPDTELARQIQRILETEFDDGKQDAAPGHVE